MTLAEMIERAQRDLTARITERRALTARITEMRTAAEAGDATVTDEAVRGVLAERTALDAQLDQLDARVVELQGEAAREAAVDALQARITPGAGRPAYDEVIRTGNVGEPRTYSRESARAGRSFFSDAYRAEQRNDYAARGRIERHHTECLVEREGTPRMVERATTTGSYAGLVVPQYLVAMAAPVLRSGRPVWNLCNRHELPAEGMSLFVTRGTTGASVAVQATQNSAVSNTDQVWADLTVPVVTLGGQQGVARQALERGAVTDAMIYADLARAYAAQGDNQVINGTGSGGQMLGLVNTAGINAATAFGAVISAANFNSKIAGQITAVTSAGAGIFPKVIIAAPRRWGWYTSLSDTTGRPIVAASQVTPMNAAALVTAPGMMGGDDDPINGLTFVGVHSSGLPVVTDLNVPQTVGTNSEDLAFVVDNAEMHLWEDGDGMPRELRFEQTAGNNLTTTLVAYAYAAFTAGRYPAAIGKLGGLDSTATFGMVAPTF